MSRLIKRLLMIFQVLCHRNDKAKIIFYHDIGKQYTPMGTDVSVFWKHMRLLRDVNEQRSGGDKHILCFDDGFHGLWDHRDMLKTYGVKPIVFLAVRLIGLPGYLSAEEITKLQNDYGFTFQCHTWSHQTLAGEMIDESPMGERTESWFQRELIESKHYLEEILHKSIDTLCFPVGNFSRDVINRCRAAGYKKVYASYPGDISDAYVQPRNLVQDMSVFDLKLVLNGGLMVFFRRYYRMHNVEDDINETLG